MHRFFFVGSLGTFLFHFPIFFFKCNLGNQMRCTVHKRGLIPSVYIHHLLSKYNYDRLELRRKYEIPSYATRFSNEMRERKVCTAANMLHLRYRLKLKLTFHICKEPEFFLHAYLCLIIKNIYMHAAKCDCLSI